MIFNNKDAYARSSAGRSAGRSHRCVRHNSGPERVISDGPTKEGVIGELPTSRLERSHPAADATREVVERWLLDGLM